MRPHDIIRLAFLAPVILTRFLPRPLGFAVLAAIAAGISGYLLWEARKRRTEGGAGLACALGLVVLTDLVFPFKIFFINSCFLMAAPFYERFLKKGNPRFDATDRRVSSVLAAWFWRRSALVLGLAVVAAAAFLLSGTGRFHWRNAVYPLLAVLLYLGLTEARDRWARRYGVWFVALLGPLLAAYLFYVFEPRPHLFLMNLIPGLVVAAVVTFLFYLLDMIDRKDSVKVAGSQLALYLAAGTKAFTIMALVYVCHQVVNRARNELGISPPGRKYRTFFSRENAVLYSLALIGAILYVFASRRYANLYLLVVLSAVAVPFWQNLTAFLAEYRPFRALRLPGSLVTAVSAEVALLAFLGIVRLMTQVPWEVLGCVLLSVNAVHLAAFAWDRWGRPGLLPAGNERILVLNCLGTAVSLVLFRYLIT